MKKPLTREAVAAGLRAAFVARGALTAPSNEPIADRVARAKRKVLDVADELLDTARARGDVTEIARALAAYQGAIERIEGKAGADERDTAPPKFLVEFASPDVEIRAEPEEAGRSADVVSIVAPQDQDEESGRSRGAA